MGFPELRSLREGPRPEPSAPHDPLLKWRDSFESVVGLRLLLLQGAAMFLPKHEEELGLPGPMQHRAYSTNGGQCGRQKHGPQKYAADDNPGAYPRRLLWFAQHNQDLRCGHSVVAQMPKDDNRATHGKCEEDH